MRTVLLALGLCLCLVSRTAAQSTATPPPFITGAQATVLYPQAIRFSLTTNLAAGGLRSATLTLATDKPLATLDVELAEAEKTPGRLDVVWTIPTDPAPKLFDFIHASWNVNAADGRQQTVNADVQLIDPRVPWVSAANNAGTLTVAAPNSVGDPSAILRAIQPVLRQLYGSAAPTFHWIIYPPNVAPGCTLDSGGQPLALDGVACDPAHAQALYDASGVRVLSAAAGTGGAASEAITADLVDARFGANWRAASVPDWFRYGFSTFFTPSRKTALLAPAVAAARAQRLIPTDRLASVNERDDLWRAESYSLVLYLTERVGIDGLMALAEKFGANRGFQPALEAALGQSLTTFVPTVQRWLLTDAAVGAYNYVPYGPPTPTPAPTATPSATATTPPTATATTFPSRTPQPTLRPTWTPIPPTPSVTPRPANSLALWTPVPTPAPPAAQPALAPFSPLGIALLTVVAALLVGLIALYIRLGRKR